ncbi:hypothetical protein HYW54_00755 [Candidatus Gottesmanbacteria bacterium]|nr:hypothetical protein [Candidatus Gottesmanbacteria bacterium]
MLEDLIISRVRVKILQLFFQNIGQMYHVREIVRRVDEEINAVRRELLHLEKAGILQKDRRANRLFYILRRDYPLHFDLLYLTAKTTGLGGGILKNRVKIGRLKYVCLSGKFIRNLPRTQNEVDLLVVGKAVIPELAQLIRHEEGRRNGEINYTVMTEDEFEFRKKRKDPFILGILNSSKLMIVGDEEELIH